MQAVLSHLGCAQLRHADLQRVRGLGLHKHRRRLSISNVDVPLQAMGRVSQYIGAALASQMAKEALQELCLAGKGLIQTRLHRDSERQYISCYVIFGRNGAAPTHMSSRLLLQGHLQVMLGREDFFI